MSKFVSKNNRKTFVATASCFFAGKMRTSALALADKYEGKVEEIKIEGQPRYKFIFDEIENRDKFVASFDRAYAKAHKAHEKKAPSSPKKKSAPKKKVAEGKGSKKMSLDDFIINNPSCTRDEAKAHGFEGTRADLKARKRKLGVR